MKIFFVGLLVITFAALGHAQSKVMAEQVRSAERIVKGAPFSAEAVSESVQTFADGNKIIRTSTSRLYRDAEGRFRRDDMPKQIGLPGAIVEIAQSVLILDPVSGSKFILDTKHNTAREQRFKSTLDQEKKREMQRAQRAEKAAERASKQRKRVEKPKGDGKFLSETEEIKIEEKAEAKAEMKHGDSFEKKVVDGKPFPGKSADNNTKTESLGVRNFEGIVADGTRTTTTIPAGTLGNQRAIEVVYEKWYSKDLQLIVFATHIDPAFGEQTYKLTNIQRAEPPITLFSPPADYRIIGERGPKPPKPSADSNAPKPPKLFTDTRKSGPGLPSPPKPAKP